MEDMRQVAYATVLRACAFGSLAIFCFMVGLSFEPRIAFQAGGVLTMGMTGILFLKAREARTKPYRRTEMWLYLPEERRPPASSAAADLRGAARNLHDVRSVDLARRRRDVGDRVVFFVLWPVACVALAMMQSVRSCARIEQLPCIPAPV